MPDKNVQIIELSPERREPALRLALRELEEAQFRVQASAFCEAENAELPGRVRVWAAFRQGALAGSLIVQEQPGRTALVWPSRLISGEPRETSHRLLDAALRALATADLCMIQALLPTDSGVDADLLQAFGLRHFSDLLYLVCPDTGFPAVAPSSDLEFLPIKPGDERRFADLVEATYEGTLDCPAVNGLRSMEDVLLGYRATGKYDPAGWLFVRRKGETLGCLIVCDHPQHETYELIYMGLTPAARRQGVGVAVVRLALWLAAQARRSRLVLAVNAANEPALKMYAAAGFRAWDSKSVFIRVMP